MTEMNDLLSELGSKTAELVNDLHALSFNDEAQNFLRDFGETFASSIEFDRMLIEKFALLADAGNLFESIRSLVTDSGRILDECFTDREDPCVGSIHSGRFEVVLLKSRIEEMIGVDTLGPNNKNYHKIDNDLLSFFDAYKSALNGQQ